jgi:N-acetyl-anhydromuramyl-L-alanine amidase AmpD
MAAWTKGRPLSEPSTSCRTHNARSISICLVGGVEGADFTEGQMTALKTVVRSLLNQYPHPHSTVCGQCDVCAAPCPHFDVATWWANTCSSRRIGLEGSNRIEHTDVQP